MNDITNLDIITDKNCRHNYLFESSLIYFKSYWIFYIKL